MLLFHRKILSTRRAGKRADFGEKAYFTAHFASFFTAKPSKISLCVISH